MFFFLSNEEINCLLDLKAQSEERILITSPAHATPNLARCKSKNIFPNTIWDPRHMMMLPHHTLARSRMLEANTDRQKTDREWKKTSRMSTRLLLQFPLLCPSLCQSVK